MSLSCCCEGQKQSFRLAYQRAEAMMLIEGNCLLIFGVDEKREGGDIGMHRPMSGICEKSCPEAAALKSLVDSQTTDAHRGESWITGQAFGLLRRQINHWNARRRERVVGSDTTGCNFDGYETVRHAAANVLSGLGLNVSIECFLAAVKRRTVVG